MERSNTLYLGNPMTGLALSAFLSKSQVVVEASGVPEFVAEIGEQLAWLGAAMRSSPFSSGEVSCCTPVFGKTTMPPSRPPDIASQRSQPLRCDIQFKFDKCSKISSAEPNGTCWHGMFNNPVVARGFPTPRRPSGGPGLEIPLKMMSRLAQARYVTDFRSKIFIKGYSTMLVPTAKHADLLTWHFMYKPNPQERISYNNCSFEHIEVKMTEVESCRHVVGWCSEAVTNIGT
jgi:hypothetical protein